MSRLKNNSRVFEEAKQIIANKGGKCLTDVCIRQYDKIKISCNKCHIWETVAKNIKCGGWCPYCYNNSRSEKKIISQNKFPEVKAFCESKGGKCLSDKYLGRKKKMHFQCEFGHEWYSTWASLVNGHWCHVCAKAAFFAKANKTPPISVPKYTIEDVKKIAIDKGGECLSDKYQNRMRFKCKFGHEWEATRGNIIGRNSWCPSCSTSLSERICRVYFETIFDKQFPTSYPSWLKNKNGNWLELDGYCEELMIAFEHNGSQHYNPLKLMGGTEQFKNNQENDLEKIKLCQENGVRLIIIPELCGNLKVENIKNLKEFIKNECIKLNINLPENYDNINIDYKEAYFSNNEIEMFNRFKQNLLNRNYELLSKEYVGSYTFYKVKCLKCDSVREIHYSSLMNSKCFVCSYNKKRLTIIKPMELATKRGGRLLSQEYINNHTKMLWECELKHQWQASYNQLQRGDWCPICADMRRGENKKIGIAPFQEVARLKGGECLTSSYKNSHEKFEWKCAVGHIFLAKGYVIKNSKRWCPFCYKERIRKHG